MQKSFDSIWGLQRAVAKEVTDAKPNKPQLRGLHHATIKRNLTVALVLSAVSVVAVKVLHNDRRKANYAEFYKYSRDITL